jgi:very-short-patch-repair endonuclease
LGEQQKRHDEERMEYLGEYGIKIIRFRNEQIIRAMTEVLNSIDEEAIKRCEK